MKYIEHIGIDKALSYTRTGSGNSGKINFYITDDVMPLLIYTPFRFHFFCLVFCTEGEISLEIDAEQHTLTAGSIVFFRPGEVHLLKKAKNLSAWGICFTNDFLNHSGKDWENPVLNPLPFFVNNADRLVPLEKKEQNMVKQYCSDIIRNFNKKESPHQQQLLQHLFMALVLEISSIYTAHYRLLHVGKAQNRNRQLVTKFKILLAQNPARLYKVIFFADALNVSPKYLSEVLKETTGYSTTHFLNEAILLEACHLLKYTDQTVASVSDTLGFSEPSAFVRFFKKALHISPLKYRNETASSIA